MPACDSSALSSQTKGVIVRELLPGVSALSVSGSGVDTGPLAATAAGFGSSPATVSRKEANRLGVDCTSVRCCGCDDPSKGSLMGLCRADSVFSVVVAVSSVVLCELLTSGVLYRCVNMISRGSRQGCF